MIPQFRPPRIRTKVEVHLANAAKEMRLALGETTEAKSEEIFRVHQQIVKLLHEERSCAQHFPEKPVSGLRR